MKNRPPVSRETLDEMHQLVVASLDDHLSAEQEARLEELVGQDLAACDLYLDLIHESSILLTWAKHDGAEGHPTTAWQNTDADPASAESHSQETEWNQTKASPAAPILGFLGDAVHGTVAYFSQGMPFSYLVATVLVGLGILIGALIPVSNPVQIVRNSTLPSPRSTLPSPLSPLPSSSPFVGRITGLVDCKWENQVGWDKLAQSHQGARISLGDTFALSSGLMELTYDTGARVILQGPVTYEVESATGGFLSVGKLTARLEKRGERRGERGEGEKKDREGSQSMGHEAQSRDWTAAHFGVLRTPYSVLPAGPSPHSSLPSPLFAVRTPTATVTDLGTEFGVDVTETGITETHVFVGTVKLEGRGESSGVPEQVLVAGQAARLDPHADAVESVEHNTEHFIRKMPVQKTTASRELIERVDYADTFTANSATRAGSYLMLRELMATAPEALQIEDCQGNPVRSWDVPGGTAIITWPNDPRWPGFKVQGSRSGLMEAGGDCHCGFEYNLHDDFVVQFDAVQTADLINITIGESSHYTDDSPSLSVFVRAAGVPTVTPFFRVPGAPMPTPGVLAPEIGLYHPQKGEIDTGFRSGIAKPHGWHNYAVRFNLPAKQLTVWVDRELRGTVDLATLKDAEGRPALAGLSWTGRYVSIGGFSPPDDKRPVWFDNFRVGSPREAETGIEQRETATSASHKK